MNTRLPASGNGVMATTKVGEPRRAKPGNIMAGTSGFGRRLPPEREGASARMSSRAQKFAESPTTKVRSGGSTMMKFMFLGDSETGKSAIVTRFTTGGFTSNYKPTVGVDFSQTNVMVGEQRLRVALWQVSESKEGSFATNTFRGLHGAFIVADIAKPETFHSVGKFRQIIDEKLAEAGGGNLPVVLVANKSDRLGEDGVSLNKASMEKLCKRHRLNGWYATSAKDNSNIDLAVKEMLQQALKGGASANFGELSFTDIEALDTEVERLNEPGVERERSPGQQALKDHQWFGAQNAAPKQGCACVVS